MLTVRNLIELTGSNLVLLQNKLNFPNLSMNSIPLLHQLSYYQNQIMKDGHVYVDEWPNFKNVCSVHSLTFPVNQKPLHLDIATFYHEGPLQKIHFENFLQSLALELQWSNRCVYGNFITESMRQSVSRVLDGFGSLEIYMCLNMYTAVQMENVPKYKKQLESFTSRLPPNLKPDILRSEDMKMVVPTWDKPDKPPEMVTPFYEWLIHTFPSACVRDGSQPVAWAGTYRCGSIANLFVDKKYRQSGVAEYVGLAMAMKFSDIIPLESYFCIDQGNPAENLAARVFKDDLKKNQELASGFFLCNETL